jgi:threonine dehydratase
MSITIQDIHAARERIGAHIIATPGLYSRTLSELTGARTFLKFENLQFTASFKERGALNCLLQLSGDERQRGVCTMSAGNHGQAVAYHAHRLGIPATVVMPRNTPFVKVEHTKSHGAEVILQGDTLLETAAYAQAITAARRLVFVHPYDDLQVIAGQGTVALEMLAAAPSLDTLVVPDRRRWTHFGYRRCCKKSIPEHRYHRACRPRAIRRCRRRCAVRSRYAVAIPLLKV